MWNWINAFNISVFLVSLPIWNHSPSQQPRNLRLYDKAGPYVISLNMDAQSRDRMESEAREFLWSHWHRRRRGYLMVTQYSKEGEPSVSSYFVEPQKNGVWQIVVKVERTLVDRKQSKGKRFDVVEYETNLIERIQLPKDGLPSTVIVPEAEERPAEAYRLVLKNKEGKVLAEI